MLKEVGTSGQISLGKKYSGQLFEVAVQPDGTIIMSPVKVVSAALTTDRPGAAHTLQSTRAWALANANHIDAYNDWASGREPYSQRVRRWRAKGV